MKITSNKVVLATGNQGKLREFYKILSPLNIKIVAQSEFDVTEAEETGLSFCENAILKARNAAEQTALPAIADDSGIEVDFLNGKPGIYSARYAEGGDSANNSKLLDALSGAPEAERGARYRCCIVYMRHAKDPSPIIADASWEGQILEQARGNKGFGYDPIFYVREHGCSAAELETEIKNQISHRAKALNTLLQLITVDYRSNTL